MSSLMVKTKFVCAVFLAETFNSYVLKPHIIEPHFGLASDSRGRDPDFDELILARWYEYLAEGYLKTTESKMAGSSSDETRVNEPVQLYLAHRRVARAKLELRIYTRLLRNELGPLLQKRMLNFVCMVILFTESASGFEDITKESLPATGLFAEPLEVSPV